MTLIEFIGWLLASGGVGYLCSHLLTWVSTYWPAFAALRPDLKRLASFALIAGTASIIGALLILLEAWMGYEAVPATAQLWVERLFVIASTAVVSSQVAHASTQETARRVALAEWQQEQWDRCEEEV